MARAILDQVVKEANKERNVIAMDTTDVFMYQGSVKTGLPKINITKMKPAPPPMSLLAPVERYYRSIKLIDAPAYLEVGENTVQTLPEVIKLIKALFLGQASKNAEYSVAITYVAQQFFTMCLRCAAVLPIPTNPGFNAFQNVVVSEASEYIKQKLDGAGIGYEEYVPVKEYVDESVSEVVEEAATGQNVVNVESDNWYEQDEDDLEF